jgi:hypothetical protein
MASHTHRNLTRCPQGGKRRFRDHVEAIDALHSAVSARQSAAMNGFVSARRECRAYLCPSCRGWHLTSSATSANSAADRLAA